MASGLFSGDSRYRLDLGTGVSGTTINASIAVTKTSGGGYFTRDAQWWRIRISGADQDGSWTYDFSGGSPKTISIATRSRAVGYGSFLVESWVNMDSGLGQAYAAEWVTITNPATPPGDPRALSFLDAARSAINLGVQYTRGAANGAAIEQDHAEWSRLSDGVVVWNDYGPAGYTSPNGGATSGAPALTPGTEYRVRVRSRNAAGWGAWSGYVTAMTRTTIRRGKGGQFVIGEVYRGKGGVFVPAEVYIGRGGVFVPAR